MIVSLFLLVLNVFRSSFSSHPCIANPCERIVENYSLSPCRNNHISVECLLEPRKPRSPQKETKAQ